MLVPGTGHFHCGSCVRDETLAGALVEQGHEVQVVPLYLPLVLDQGVPSFELAPLQLGGINLYLQHRWSWARYLPQPIRRLLDHPTLLRWASRRGGMTASPSLGSLTVATLEGEHGVLGPFLRQLPETLSDPPAPDLIVLSNAMLLGLAEGLRRRFPKARVQCTLQGELPFIEQLPSPYRERVLDLIAIHSQNIDDLIAVSSWYANRMEERLKLQPGQCRVVPNGIALPATGPASLHTQNVPTIGFLARLCRDKGLHVLVDAFVHLRTSGKHDALRLRVCGTLQPEDRGPLELLRVETQDLGIDEHIDILTEVSLAAKRRFLASLSVLCVPATYGESFGLYVLEALAAGVPVVMPDHGGLRELVLDTGGGILYDPEQEGALSDALDTLLGDPDLRARLAVQGQERVHEYYTATQMADRVLGAGATLSQG